MPTSLLVMPPINNTTNIEAKELLYTSINKPLAESGYYVFSPLLVMDILKNESGYDSELFIDAPLGKFKEVFGADAVVFPIIETWAKQGFGIRTKLHYIIKSTKTNNILFDRTCDLYLDLSSSSSNDNNNSLLSVALDIAASAINTALTEHIEAARKANAYIFAEMPRGRYHADFMKDQAFSVHSKDIKVTVK